MYISDEFNKKYIKSQLCEGDMLIVQSGHVGECAVVTPKYAGANCHAVIIVSPKSETLDTHYLVQFFYSPQGRRMVDRMKTGNTVQHILATDIAKLEINLPNILEQHKIADFLGSVDAWLDNLRKQKTALETYKRGMMQKLFRQEIRFKDENGKEYPEWEKYTLGQLYRFVPTNSLSRSDLSHTEGSVYNIHYGDVHTVLPSHLSLSTRQLPRIRAEALVSDYERQLCSTGDIVLADASEDYNDVGKAMELVNVSGKQVCGGLHTIVLRPREKDRFHLGFAGHMFKAWDVRKQMMRYATGAKVLGLSKSSLDKIEVTLPCSREQQKIADFLTSLDQTITAKADEIAKVEQWKKGLMQKMFV